MLIINNRFLSVYDYNFLLYYEKIFSVKQPKDQRFQGMKDKRLLEIRKIIIQRIEKCIKKEIMKDKT